MSHKSHSPAFRRAAAVVRNGGNVLDESHAEADGGQGAESRLATGAGATYEYLHGTHAVFRRFAGGILGRDLRRERRVLAGATEPLATGARPGDRVTHRVGNRHDGVVERGENIDVSGGNVLLAPL